MAGPVGRKTAKAIRPCLNVFSIFDHMTGNYVRGYDGAWYLNGGLHPITGYGGRGNTFKTTFSTSNYITAYVRYMAEYGETYDTELSFNIDRVGTLAAVVPEASKVDFKQLVLDGKFNIVTSIEMLGDEWWGGLRKSVDDRKKIANGRMRVTPFIDFDGERRVIPDPWLFNLDSLSMMQTRSTEDMMDKGDVGASDLNTLAMKGAAAKSQMMAQMPIVTGAGGMYVSVVAHLGDGIVMNTHAPSTKKLQGLKGDQKLKGVPENFTFLTNNCFIATGNVPLLDAKKLPEFPKPDVPYEPGNTDLRLITFEQLRGKAGPTGATIKIVVSQSEGINVPLTEFYYLLRTLGGFGMNVSANKVHYTLDLYPEVTFTRKQIYEMGHNDPKFRRALAITASLGYIYHNYFDSTDLQMPIPELYKKITDLGYDWNEILTDTVEYWYFKDQEKSIGKPTLTAMTILQMANEKYVAKFLKTNPSKTKK